MKIDLDARFSSGISILLGVIDIRRRIDGSTTRALCSEARLIAQGKRVCLNTFNENFRPLFPCPDSLYSTAEFMPVSWPGVPEALLINFHRFGAL